MVSKPFQRPFSLATRLTFFISLATIAAFFAFAWIMIHSVKVHFAEQDINDLKEISATLERVLNHPDETQARRLMTLEDIVSGYSNVLISLADSQGKTVYHSPGAPDIREFTRDAIPDKDAQGGEADKKGQAVKRLRGKIDNDFEPKLIQTVRGVGYMLEVPDGQ